MSANGHFTPTHQRMYAVLSDGFPHTAQELCGCLWDDLSDPKTVLFHLSTMRKSLRQRSEGLRTAREPNGVVTYQLVRLMASPYDE